MLDVSTVVAAMGGVGFLKFAQNAVKYVRDERRKSIENARSDAAAPLVAGSQWLGIVDQAQVIQQRTITTLQEQLAQVQLEVSTLRSENTALREQDKIKTAQIKDLYATIGQLESESRKPRGRSSP